MNGIELVPGERLFREKLVARFGGKRGGIDAAEPAIVRPQFPGTSAVQNATRRSTRADAVSVSSVDLIAIAEPQDDHLRALIAGGETVAERKTKVPAGGLAAAVAAFANTAGGGLCSASQTTTK